ncbi:MAG: hypothetical protein AAB521_01715 [Patescibacteria group bacterium]
MEDNGNSIGSFIGGAIIIGIVWFLFSGSGKYEGENAEYWYNEYDAETAVSESYKTALEEANSNIEEANDMIDNAKSYDDAESLIDGVNSLEEIETVAEPY